MTKKNEKPEPYDIRCEVCKFYQPRRGENRKLLNNGFCRINPPIVEASRIKNFEAKDLWPVVSARAWCGKIEVDLLKRGRDIRDDAILKN